MTSQKLLEKYKALYERLGQSMDAENDKFKHGTLYLYREIVQDFIEDLTILAFDNQDFACDYLRNGESLNSMPRCLIRAYCDPRGCKDREVNTYRLMTKEQIAGKKIMISRPTQDQVESFWEDGDE